MGFWVKVEGYGLKSVGFRVPVWGLGFFTILFPRGLFVGPFIRTTLAWSTSLVIRACRVFLWFRTCRVFDGSSAEAQH